MRTAELINILQILKNWNINTVSIKDSTIIGHSLDSWSDIEKEDFIDSLRVHAEFIDSNKIKIYLS